MLSTVAICHQNTACCGHFLKNDTNGYEKKNLLLTQK